MKQPKKDANWFSNAFLYLLGRVTAMVVSALILTYGPAVLRRVRAAYDKISYRRNSILFVQRETLRGEPYLYEANLSNLSMSHRNYSHATLTGAKFDHTSMRDCDLSGANLQRASIVDSDLSGSDLSGADPRHTVLSRVDLRGADLTGALIYGISVWDVKLDRAIQKDLIISTPDGTTVTVDNLEVAQFIYLLLS